MAVAVAATVTSGLSAAALAAAAVAALTMLRSRRLLAGAGDGGSFGIQTAQKPRACCLRWQGHCDGRAGRPSRGHRTTSRWTLPTRRAANLRGWSACQWNSRGEYIDLDGVSLGRWARVRSAAGQAGPRGTGGGHAHLHTLAGMRHLAHHGSSAYATIPPLADFPP